MALPTASDNLFPKVILVEGTTPANPSAGDQKIFIDSADHKLKRVNSSGTVTTIESAGGASQGTPALTLSTSNSAGSSGSYVGTDATIAAFDATAPVTQAFGDSAAAGTAGTAARRDHKHGIPAASSIPGNIIGYTSYTRATDNFLGGAGTTSATLVDADATNAIVTFTAPASGNVIVMMSCAAFPGSTTLFVGLRESTTVVGPETLASGVTSAGAHNTWFWIITGISAGSHTYKAAQATAGTAAGLGSGPTYGPIVLVVMAL